MVAKHTIVAEYSIVVEPGIVAEHSIVDKSSIVVEFSIVAKPCVTNPDRYKIDHTEHTPPIREVGDSKS